MEDTRNVACDGRDISTKEKIKIFIKRNVMILLIILAYVAIAWILNMECPIRRVLRRPCPACGITRAWGQALQLNFKEAMYYHPLFWFVPMYVWVVINREVWPIDKIPEKLYKIFMCQNGEF